MSSRVTTPAGSQNTAGRTELSVPSLHETGQGPWVRNSSLALHGQQPLFPGLHRSRGGPAPVTTQPHSPAPQGLGRTQLKAQLRGLRRVPLVSLHTRQPQACKLKGPGREWPVRRGHHLCCGCGWGAGGDQAGDRQRWWPSKPSWSQHQQGDSWVAKAGQLDISCA